MKPANFPEHKRQRQLRALERQKPITPREHIERRAEIGGDRRDVRTKKDRSANAKFSRHA